MSLHAWVHAWEAAMAEGGYPRARLDPGKYGDGEEWSYGWMSDLDEFAAGLPQSDQAWDYAHMAFLLVDDLRPSWVRPSVILQQILEARDAQPG